jgi:hypothetical protein
MTQEHVSEKWTNLFCRVADRDANTPRFSLIGSKGYLYEFDGYFGGHEELDQIITILEKNGIKRHSSGSYNPGSSVSTYEWVYDFEDGGLEIYSGNYLFHASGLGAFVVGFKAFRWLLDQLGTKQPRRFKNEAAAE